MGGAAVTRPAVVISERCVQVYVCVCYSVGVEVFVRALVLLCAMRLCVYLLFIAYT